MSKQPSTQPSTLMGKHMQLKTQQSYRGCKVYIPKVICVISKYNFNDYYAEIIEDLYYGSKACMINPIESYVSRITLEVSIYK